jgi:hypothetical protein
MGANGNGTHGPEGERSADDALLAFTAAIGEGTRTIVDTFGEGMRAVGEFNLEASRKVGALLASGIDAQARRADGLEARVRRLEETLLALLKERAAERGGGGS